MSKTASVVIPVRNRPDLLAKCLESLASQEFDPDQFEVLVCDDGSTQDLSPVVEAFRPRMGSIRLLCLKKPGGPAAARNLGIRSSSAPIVVCVDSDEICHPRFLGEISRSMMNHPEWMAAEGTVLPIGGRAGILTDAPENNGKAYLSAASAYRREALLSVGGFDEAFQLAACEDVDLAVNLLQLGEFAYVPDAVVYHPVRQVTLRTHWAWRRHWKYTMFLAKRYGILAFPHKSAGNFPRLRVAIAAILTLPAGRFLVGLKNLNRNVRESLLACLFAVFDVLCGTAALLEILFSSVPERKNYLQRPGPDLCQRPDIPETAAFA